MMLMDTKGEWLQFVSSVVYNVRGRKIKTKSMQVKLFFIRLNRLIIL